MGFYPTSLFNILHSLGLLTTGVVALILYFLVRSASVGALLRALGEKHQEQSEMSEEERIEADKQSLAREQAAYDWVWGWANRDDEELAR